MANISEKLKELFNGIETTMNTKTCVGKEIKVGDTTIIPLVELTIGAGTVEADGKTINIEESGGFAARVTPVACLVVQNGFTKVIHVKSSDPISKALDMIPDIIDKMAGEDPEVQEAVEESLDDSYIENI